MDSIVLLSGGLDSFIMSSLARDNCDKVYGLTFNYNQKNSKEIDCAKNVSEYFKFNDHFILDIDFSLLKSSLINNSTVSDSSYVPARNLIFLSYAIGIAESLKADAIAIGATAADYSIESLNRQGYPDCHPDFFREVQNITSMISSKPIRIFAPLINSTKEQMIKYGIKKNLDFSKTWSCYTNNEVACGECLACKNRIMGFYLAGEVDTQKYKKDYSTLVEEIKKEWKV